MEPQTFSPEVQAPNGMLFVRMADTDETMVNTPIVIAGLVAVALAVPIQPSLGTTRALDLVLYSDGSVHVTHGLDVDPLEPELRVDLFGPSVDNFIALQDGGFLLSSEIDGEEASVSTFGHSHVTIDYDIHDLVSKEGRVWTFSLDSHSPYTLLMPADAIIIGMSAAPLVMDIIDDSVLLQLGAGQSEVDYVLAASPAGMQAQENAFFLASLGAAAAAAVAGGVVLAKRMTSRRVQDVPAEARDIEEAMDQEQDMREDDKRIVRFISDNGGEVLESELRKKFLLPRTTMWRAVKRLERLGIIEISKRDQQNLVRLKEGAQ